MPRITKERIATIRNTYNRLQNYKSTAKETGVDMRTVKKYVENLQDSDDKNENNNKFQEAMKLFAAGKAPVEVGIALGAGYEEVKNYYTQYCTLNNINRHNQLQLHDPALYNSLMELYDYANKAGIDVIQLASELHSSGSVEAHRREIRDVLDSKKATKSETNRIEDECQDKRRQLELVSLQLEEEQKLEQASK